MKRSHLGVICGVLIFVIGCQQEGGQSSTASNTATSNQTPAQTPPATTTAPVAVAAKAGYPAVQDIFNARCMPCHSPSKRRGGQDLTSYEAIMKGGTDGVMVIAGDPDKSPLVMYLTGAKKPKMPMNAAPLADADMQTIKDWIKSGAKNG
jgi:uncharacterized membrane protein